MNELLSALFGSAVTVVIMIVGKIVDSCAERKRQSAAHAHELELESLRFEHETKRILWNRRIEEIDAVSEELGALMAWFESALVTKDDIFDDELETSVRQLKMVIAKSLVLRRHDNLYRCIEEFATQARSCLEGRLPQDDRGKDHAALNELYSKAMNEIEKLMSP
jgi:hypothetical protein